MVVVYDVSSRDSFESGAPRWIVRNVVQLPCWQPALGSFLRSAQSRATSLPCQPYSHFLPLLQWDIERYAAEGVPIILVGNKCDVSEETRMVTYEEGQALKDEHDSVTHFIEASAKRNIQARFPETHRYHLFHAHHLLTS